LAILAAIVVFAVQNLTGQSAKAACNADYKTVETAAEAYKAQIGAYPTGDGTTAQAGTYSVTPAALAGGYVSPTGSVGAQYLMGTTPAGGPGPWLKDFPVNAGHYEIVVGSLSTATTGAGVPGAVTVYNAAGTAPVTGTGVAACANVS
jgi:general secretion pathway protein G